MQVWPTTFGPINEGISGSCSENRDGTHSGNPTEISLKGILVRFLLGQVSRRENTANLLTLTVDPIPLELDTVTDGKRKALGGSKTIKLPSSKAKTSRTRHRVDWR